MNKRAMGAMVPVMAGAVLMLLAGCMQSAGSGSIAFSFGSGKALAAGESYRVDIYYGLDLYDSYPEITVTPYEIEGLPTGLATVFVSAGKGAGDAFVPSRVTKLDLTIRPGDNAPTALRLEPTAFANALPGVGVRSVVALGDTIYAATDNGLKSGSMDGFADGPAVPEGMEVKSLSVAQFFDGAVGFVDQVWVNGTWSKTTTEGAILPWVGDDLDETFTDGLSTPDLWDNGVADFTVLRSGSFPIEATAEDDLAIFFQRDGGIGGVVILRSEVDTPSGWPWITDQIDLTAALEGISIGEPILDFAVSGKALYLVASFTTLKLSENAIKATEDITVDKLLDPSLGYAAFAPGVQTSIISIGLGGGNVYLGTGNGLFFGPVSLEGGSFFLNDQAPDRVSGTQGYSIQTIAVSPSGVVAFIADRGDDSLAVWKDEALTLYRRPQGLPGYNLTGLYWVSADTLLVSGDSGVALLDVDP